jgi:hypothetical protein
MHAHLRDIAGRRLADTLAKRSAKAEREAPISLASEATVQSRSGSRWIAASTLPTSGQRAAAIQPVASPQPLSTQERMMLAASTSASRARMPPAPTRSIATSRAIASRRCGMPDSLVARSHMRISSGIIRSRGWALSTLKVMLPLKSRVASPSPPPLRSKTLPQTFSTWQLPSGKASTSGALASTCSAPRGNSSASPSRNSIHSFAGVSSQQPRLPMK